MIISPVQKVLDRLDGVKKQGTGWRARCPAHDDRRPSLDINTGNDGRVLLICRSHGCTIDKIASVLGLSVRDLFPGDENAQARTSKSRRPQKKLSAAKTTPGHTFLTASDAVAYLKSTMPHSHVEFYPYQDADGTLIGATVILRNGDKPKEVRPISGSGGRWQVEAMPAPRPLYHLPELWPDGAALPGGVRFFIVEGEPCVEAMRSVGLLATTSAGGSRAAKHADWSPLADMEVVILPDNDEAGDEYAADVVDELSKLNPMPEIRRVDLPGLPRKGDIADYITQRRDEGWSDERIRDDIEAQADAAPCIEVQRLQLPVPRYEPFPVEVLPEVLRNLVEQGAEAVGGSVDYFVAALLPTVTAAIGNAWVVELKSSWRAPAAMWAAIIGESGTGKTEPLRIVTEVIKARQRQHVATYQHELKEHDVQEAAYRRKLRSWENGKAEGAPPERPTPPVCKRLWTEDSTPERLVGLLAENPRGLLLIVPELAGWIGNFGRYTGARGADSAKWLPMFDADDLVSDRQSRGMTSVPRALVSIVGTIQPETFRDMIGNEHRANGLLARLLVVYPPRRAKRWTTAHIPKATEAAFARCIDRLLSLDVFIDDHGCPQPRSILLTPDAQARFAQFVNDHGAETMTLSGDLAAAWSKLEAYVARFALIFHAMRWAADDLPPDRIGKIGVNDLEAAIVAARWFGEQAKRVYDLFHENGAGRERRALVDYIERHGGCMRPRELVQSSQRFGRTVAEVTALMDVLVEDGYARWDCSKEPGKPGPAPKVLQLVGKPAGSTNTYKFGLGAIENREPVGVGADVESENTIDAPTVAGHDEFTSDTL